MQKDDFFYLGRILGTYGHQGELTALLDSEEPEKYMQLESVFVEIDQEQVPFFITSIRLHQGKKAVIRFEDVNTPEDAEPFSGCKLFLPVTMLPKLSGNKFYYHEVLKFKVIDEMYGEIGVLESILEMPGQDLLRILNGKKEILIPVADPIIRKVDRRNRTLRICAPEGLIALYL